MSTLDPAREQACKDFKQYIQQIVSPAMSQLDSALRQGTVPLHQVYGANLFMAHAVDYIQAIRRADGMEETRTSLVRAFDELYGVQGARVSNRKFELIDAINNSLKHIRLDEARYRHLNEKYGGMSFRSLIEEEGRVLCLLEGYRFDYTRVVLSPAYRALTACDFESSTAEILEFARGGCVLGEWSPEDELMTSTDPSDAIDQMIAFCNPTCDDCGETEDGCYCAKFIYEGEQGRFESKFRTDFDFDTVMSRISGAYRPEAK